MLILIIHTDQLVIDLLKNELTTQNTRVVGATSGASAKVFAETDRPDLVIFDPDIDQSLDLLTQIRSNDHPCAVVALSGSPEMLRTLESLGVETIVNKEDGLPILLQAARAYLFADDNVSPPAVARAHILVVDDEEDLLELICAYLKQQGYLVSTARNGKQALEIIEQEEPPKIVILDIRMPEMGGLEMLSRMKSHQSTPGVLVVTALHDREIARRAAELGAFDYILKPFDFDRLGEAVLACLEEVDYRRRPWWKRLMT